MTNPMTNPILANQHKALGLYWSKLSKQGKEYVCHRVQFVGSYVSNVVNTESAAALAKYRPDLIYDLYTFAKERYEEEYIQLQESLSKLEDEN